MSQEGSVTRLLKALREGDDDAAAQLWERYFRRLEGVAHTHLAPVRSKACDEEDVALSAYFTFCRRYRGGEYESLRDRDEFWRLLACITKRKSINVLRYEGAVIHGGNKVQGGLALERVIGAEVTPSDMAELLDEQRRVMDVLRSEDETLCLIAQRKFEGFTNREIAPELCRSVRAVQRKVKRIQILWAEDRDRRDKEC